MVAVLSYIYTHIALHGYNTVLLLQNIRTFGTPTFSRAPVASLVASLDDDVCLDAIDVFPRRERGAVGE